MFGIEIQLTEEQFTFISSKLPKGYFLQKTRGKKSKKNRLDQLSDLSSKQETPVLKVKQNTPIEDQSTHTGGQKIKSKIQGSKNIINKKPQTFDKTVKELVNNLLKQIMKKKSAEIFIQPVDPVKLQIPTYFKVIKHPMSLEKIFNKLENNQYINFDQVVDDLKLIVQNCLKFNEGNAWFIDQAVKFQKDWKKLVQKHQKKISEFTTKQKKTQQQLHQNCEQKSPTIKQRNEKSLSKIKNDSPNSTPNLKNVKRGRKTPQRKKFNNKQVDKSLYSNSQEQRQQKEQKRIIKNQKKKSKDQSSEESHSSSFQSSKKSKQSSKSRTRKNYDFKQRKQIVSRIKELQKETMIQFFQAIDFKKDQHLDFKILENQRVAIIDQKLQHYEALSRKKIIQYAKKNEKNQQLQIAEDRDYEN